MQKADLNWSCESGRVLCLSHSLSLSLSKFECATLYAFFLPRTLPLSCCSCSLSLLSILAPFSLPSLSFLSPLLSAFSTLYSLYSLSLYGRSLKTALFHFYLTKFFRVSFQTSFILLHFFSSSKIFVFYFKKKKLNSPNEFSGT